MAGLFLDDWQRFVLRHALGEAVDGKWAAGRVGLVVGRQNGKNGVLEARELAGIFLFGERLIIHTAHEQATAGVQHKRLVERLRSSPTLWRKVDRPIYGKGSEAIRFKSGQEILFRTRTGGAGKGMTADCLVFDEAFNLPDAAMSALLPTMAARSKGGNLQRWYTSSAVDQQNPEHNGLVLARIRERGLKGDARDLAYFEWSVDWDDPNTVPPEMARDPQVWAKANPAQGIRITTEWIEGERTGGEMSARGWAVERLGIGDWPAIDGSDVHPISPARWAKCVDLASKPLNPVSFAFDTTPDNSATSIAVAGRREDGGWHVGVVDQLNGTDGVPARLAGLVREHKPAAIFCDASNAGAASLLLALGKLKVPGTKPGKSPIKVVTANEHAQACARLQDAVGAQGAPRVFHHGSPCLSAAIEGARKRTLNDGGWLWHRISSGVDISPLVAVTLALSAAMGTRGGSYVTSLSEIAGQTGDDAEADAKMMAEMQTEAEDFYRDVTKADDE